MTTRDTHQRGTISEQIDETVSSWPNIVAGEGRFNSTSFKLAGREIGHLHSKLADITYPKPLGDQLIAEGQTEEHHVVPDSNAMTFHIESADDIDHVVWLFRLSYLVRVSIRQKRGENEPDLTDIDVKEELDELAPSTAVRSAFDTAVAT